MQSLYGDFHERAEALQVSDESARAFNDTHNLSLNLGHHLNKVDADEALKHVTEDMFVHIESTSFDRSRFGEPIVSLDERPDPEKVRTYQEKSFGHKVLNSMVYNGLAFYRMQLDEPKKYTEYRERTFADLEASGGFFGLDLFSGYRTSLLFGILDRGSVYVPNDADSEQLPTDEANYLRGNSGPLVLPKSIQEIVASDEIDSYYSDIEAKAIARQNMYHYRDIALVKNITTYDEVAYRGLLGKTNQDRLQTQIIRGSGHFESLVDQLDKNDIKYRVSRAVRSPDALTVAKGFGYSPEAQAIVAQEAGKALDQFFDENKKSLLVREFELTEQADLIEIFKEASRTEDGFKSVISLDKKIRAVEVANRWQKNRHGKALQECITTVRQLTARK